MIALALFFGIQYHEHLHNHLISLIFIHLVRSAHVVCPYQIS